MVRIKKTDIKNVESKVFDCSFIDSSYGLNLRKIETQ